MISEIRSISFYTDGGSLVKKYAVFIDDKFKISYDTLEEAESFIRGLKNG